MDFTSQILRSTTMPANQTWPADQEQPEGKASTSCAVKWWEKMRKEVEVRSSRKISTSAHPSSMLNLLFQASVPRQRFMKKTFMDTCGHCGHCGHVYSLTRWEANITQCISKLITSDGSLTALTHPCTCVKLLSLPERGLLWNVINNPYRPRQCNYWCFPDKGPRWTQQKSRTSSVELFGQLVMTTKHWSKPLRRTLGSPLSISATWCTSTKKTGLHGLHFPTILNVDVLCMLAKVSLAPWVGCRLNLILDSVKTFGV